MNKRFDVVISSTTKDLSAYREAAYRAIVEAGMYPYAMEDGAATGKDPLTFSLDLIDKAHVYVGIFGLRYGYVPVDPARNPDNLSITELEFRRAQAKKLPMCIFLIDKYEIGLEQLDEKPARLKKLKALRDELQTKYYVRSCSSVEQLHLEIFKALTALERDGLVLANDEPAATHRGAVKIFPTPPKPYIAHPYTLAQDFYGRAAELGELDGWARSNDPVMIVEAIGGIGKSALTWEWLNKRAVTAIPNLAGVVWWSFYDSDGTLPNLVRHALAYLTSRSLDEIDATLPAQRETELLRFLAEYPVLLVFDGFERTLAAYHQIEAPRLNDESVQAAHDARRCTDPRDGEFLAKLAACRPSKVLISTRLIPRELEHRHTEKPLPGVRHCQLSGLAPGDALALMQHLGTTGSAQAITDFTAKFGNHSLLINILAKRIIKHREAEGNFDAWLRMEGAALRLSDLKEDMAQNRTFILQYALAGLTTEQSLLLSRIAAFRYPLDYQALKAINPYVPSRPAELKPNNLPRLLSELEVSRRHAADEMLSKLDRARWEIQVSDLEAEVAAYQAHQRQIEAYPAALKDAVKALNTALDELQERGLLQHSGKAYDLHPVVRGYAFEQLTGSDRATTFAQIRDHFSALPPENLKTVQDIHDLRRTLEIYSALVGEQQLDKASDFYGERLANVLEYTIAAYPLIVELLAPFFSRGTDQLPVLSTPTRQSGRVTNLANVYFHQDQTEQALVLYGLGLEIRLEQKDTHNLGVGLLNYANTLSRDSRYASALRVCRLAFELATAAGDTDELAMSHLRLLAQYVATGQWESAAAEYRAFKVRPPSLDTDFWQSTAERHDAEMQVHQGLEADAALDRADALAHTSQNALEQREALWLRGQFALEQNRPAEAVDPLLKAIQLAHKSGEPTGRYRGDLARAYVHTGRHDEARQRVEEGIPDLATAEVYLELGKRETARDHVLKAYKKAWADGDPYSNWYDLKRARALLAALGEPEPTLPPFDPANVEPIPYEAEIVAFIEALKAKKGR